MRWARAGGPAVAALAILVASTLVSCADDEYRRPGPQAGKAIAVLDADTPGVPPNSTLTDIAVGKDDVLFAGFSVEREPGERETGLILGVPADGEPFVVADETENTFPEPVLFGPESFVLDPGSGTLYVADSESQWIRAIDPDGKRRNVVSFGEGLLLGPPTTSLQQPLYLAIDPASDRLFMADNCQIAQIKGEEVRVIAGKIGCDTDDEKNVGWVSPDTGVAAAEIGTTTIAGLAYDTRAGLLHFVDNRGLFRLEPDGTLLRLAGEGTTPFREDGPNRAREVDLEFSGGGGFVSGGGITFDREGTLYLAAPHDDLVVRMTSDRATIEKVFAAKEPRRLVFGLRRELFVSLSLRERGDDPTVLVYPTRKGSD